MLRLTSILVFALLAAASACRAQEKPQPVVYYPADVSQPVPVAVWLHGYRNFPSILSDKEYFQSMADSLESLPKVLS
jgi:hypothetical protein